MWPELPVPLELDQSVEPVATNYRCTIFSDHLTQRTSMKSQKTAALFTALVVSFGLSACSKTEGNAAVGSSATASASTMPSASTVPDAGNSMAGSWIDLARYKADMAAFQKSGDVVLFFNASWCPTCQATVKSLDSAGVPAGLTVVSVDFDNSAELRKKYGVTVQHTFVQVDLDGMELMKFTGTTSGAEIAMKTI